MEKTRDLTDPKTVMTIANQLAVHAQRLSKQAGEASVQELFDYANVRRQLTRAFIGFIPPQYPAHVRRLHEVIEQLKHVALNQMLMKFEKSRPDPDPTLFNPMMASLMSDALGEANLEGKAIESVISHGWFYRRTLFLGMYSDASKESFERIAQVILERVGPKPDESPIKEDVSSVFLGTPIGDDKMLASILGKAPKSAARAAELILMMKTFPGFAFEQENSGCITENPLEQIIRHAGPNEDECIQQCPQLIPYVERAACRLLAEDARLETLDAFFSYESCNYVPTELKLQALRLIVADAKARPPSEQLALMVDDILSSLELCKDVAEEHKKPLREVMSTLSELYEKVMAEIKNIDP